MTFPTHPTVTDDDGTIAFAETVVADVDELQALEKGLTVLGTKAVLRIEFDPPLHAAVTA